MNRYSVIVLAALLTPALVFANPGKPDIVVMTQNQYLGADLTEIISADSTEAYAVAVLDALDSIAYNNIPERAEALALSIVERDAHLVGLQEVFSFHCVPNPGFPWLFPGTPCDLFSAAMNNHLQLTMAALSGLGADYYVAGIVENLNIPNEAFVSVGLPGLPVFIDQSGNPAAFIQVLDRDVILARVDVGTSIVDFTTTFPGLICNKPSADGCNYDFIASAAIELGGTELVIDIERGYVAVDAIVDDKAYRFVNTHLEVRFPSPDPNSAIFQAVQASELTTALALTPPAHPGSELLLVGDINSSPEDPVFPYPFFPPYAQLTIGMDFLGTPLPFPFALTDTWNLRPGKPKGNTCCQADDLSNKKSMLYERIDVIFSLNPPARVKANVLNNNQEDKTPSGLWPSDHATVVGRLFFD